MSENCLYCYEPLSTTESDYHQLCISRLFGTKKSPVIELDLNEIENLAKKEINQRISIPGVQRKLSLDLIKGNSPRLTIVGLWGEFIFKPPTPEYPHLPEIEDLCMHLAERLGIRVATHGLIRMPKGELGYISRRFDRVGNQRLALEDFCQLTETATADKYFCSVEKVGKTLRCFSDNPGLDVQRFLEIVLFSYLTGNADMHLKNYALLRDTDNELGLAPAYDLVSTKLVLPEDKEESALAINGRKHKLRREDFIKLAEYLHIEVTFFSSILQRWSEKLSTIHEVINQSFLPKRYKEELVALFNQRLHTIAS